ncbi:MAG: putative glycolipid-binding domain-containing protein [Candidatus Dormibacteraeota bacterium]|nr:putative glycolipid-binding domain-containing protein [Candidatus Dormibacteraeota bacterium]MBO0743536.1 putative glycolipid-binding domain-containing protein [Candidatus Dormibacteraeota bacterium]
MRSYGWRRLDTPGLELATWRPRADGALLQGRVLVVEGGSHLSVDYRIEVDGRWVTRLVDVDVVADGHPAALRLEHDGAGGWRRDGRPDSALERCLDVDLQVTPLTNALPVNRLRLAGDGAAAEILAAWVHFPGLSVNAAPQRYQRLAPTTYRYTSLDSGFTAQVEMDENGFPIIYEGLWQRA